jgi:NADPH2 dehydrogenase
MSSKIFTPLQVGNSTLQQRIVMAPLTRFRADDNHVQLDFVKEYYEQRASVPGSFLITEATFISPRAGGYPNVPGIYNQEQIKAWKEITDVVHAKKSSIWVQLWALGRVANPDILKADGYKLLSSSATPEAEGKPVPEEMSENDIQEFIAAYAQAAKNAIEAGFDGVEIHGANGYLIDQFTQDTANKRTDTWGGSVENRARFALEVTKAVVAAIGPERTGIRLSPFSDFQGMKMADPVPQFSYLTKELKQYNLAYLHLVESRISGNATVDCSDNISVFVDIWANQSPVFIAGGFDAETAQKAVNEEYKNSDVAVVFGRYYISSPDLPYRVKNNIPFTPYDRNTFYNAKSTVGYLDYPFSKEFMAAAKA